MPSRPASLPSLTGVRFVAAALVLGSHFAPDGVVPSASGPASVTLFFLLSGFILTYTAPERLRTRAFYSARLARIYPAYLLGLLPMLLLLAFGAPGATPTITCPTPAGAVLPDLLLLQAWNPRLMACLNDPTWSVSCEMTFYLLFPLLLPGVRRLSERGAGYLLVGVWIIAVALPTIFLLAHPLLHTDAGPLGYLVLRWSPAVRLLDFVAGMLLGQLWLHGLRLPRPGLWAASALSALPLVGGIVPAHPGMVPVQDALLWPALLLLIGALAHGSSPGAGFSPLAWLLARPVMVALGDASYGLYLFHWPLHTLFADAGLIREGDWLTFAVYAALTVVLSLFSYRLFETPARRVLLHALLAQPRRVPETAPAMPICGQRSA